jgi:ribose/xylose/arabinose/galactoside ABC-type transport system permease subunit
MAIVFTAINGYFISSGNLLGLLRATSSLAIVALGQSLVIIAGELDLSIGSIYGFAGTIMAVLWIEHRMPLELALPLALGAACVVGVVNGFFTVGMRIPSFIVTLGTLSIVQGMTLLFGHSQVFDPSFVVPPLPSSERSVFGALGGSTLPFGIPVQVVWLAGAAVVFALVLHASLFGFRLTAIGGNPEAARLARLPVARYKLAVFVVCGLTAGLAGILDFSFLGTTQPQSGSQLTFPVFAAVIIGGASLTGGSGTVLGTLSGALLLSVLANGLALIGVGPFAQLIFVGGVTIGAVLVDRWGTLWPVWRSAWKVRWAARSRSR